MDCSGGRLFDHANSGVLYPCLVCGNHVPRRHDPLAQCCRFGDAEYVSFHACEQVLNGVEQQRPRKEKEHSSCLYARMSC
jgi:hypothetical protein